MRGLTKKQKSYLDEYCSKCDRVDDMAGFQWSHLCQMNDFETIYQETNNYLWERATK